MMSRELPAKPNLEYLKKQAKELLHDFQRSKPHAADRFRAFASSCTPANAKLAAAVCAQNSEDVAELLRNHPELKARLNEPFHYGDLPILLAAVQRTDR